jgi:hypothetical protein
MRKLLFFLIIGLLILSFSGEARWEKLWDERVSTLVINHDQIENATRLFAVKESTKDIYRLNKSLDQWEKVGNPGRKFVATGGKVYGIDPAGGGVYMFQGRPEEWLTIGGAATDLYAGGGRVYATNPDTGDIWEYKGRPMQWERIGGPGTVDPPFKTIFAAAGDESVSQPRLYRLDVTGCPDEYLRTPDQWRSMGCLASGKIREIYAAGYNVYARDYDGKIYHYYVNESAWRQIGTGSKMLAADFAGSGQGRMGRIIGPTYLYSLSSDGRAIWKYEGDPNQWSEVKTSGFSLPLKEIYAGGSELYATTENSILYMYEP